MYPVIPPGGKTVIYCKSVWSLRTPSDSDGIYARSLEANTERLLVPHGLHPLYASGYLLFMTQENQLMAQAFDPSRMELQGDAALVAEQVRFYSRADQGSVSVSQNDLLVYQKGFNAIPATLIIRDRTGRIVQELETKGSYDDPMFSRDGARLAVTRYDYGAQGDIWIRDLARGTMSRFTFDPAEEDDPVWSPDGTAIIYARDGELVRKSSSGVGPVEVLYASSTDKVPYDISRDGKFLLYADLNQKTLRDLWVLPLEGDRKPMPIAQSEFSEINGQFSPDGEWIAYSSNETGTDEVYVQSFRQKGGKWQVSSQGGVQPRWTQAGKEIVFVDLNGTLLAVDIRADHATLHVGTPNVLFKADINPAPVRPVYDITGDGLRVISMRFDESSLSGTPLNLVQNWMEELKTQ
jgi:Tol biopolymer transport system component